MLAEVDGTRGQAAIARRLGITRQSAHALVRHLVDLDVVVVEDGTVRPSRTGAAMLRDAGELLAVLEAELDPVVRPALERWWAGRGGADGHGTDLG